MKFTHLHTHSHYSLLDGLPKIPELLDYVKELGMDSVALTDHGVLYGAVEFYQEAKARGIKPIIGVEAYVAFESRLQKRPNIDARSYHMILLAKNKKGYENLVTLVTLAHLEGFYYKPRIDEELLEKHAEGLIGTSACINGKIPRLLLAGKDEEAQALAKKYESWFGKGNFYLELQHQDNIKEQKVLNKKLVALSQKTGIPLIATNDIHYLRPEDAEAQDVLMLINTGSDPNDPERLSLKEIDVSMRSPEKMVELFKDIPEALENTQKIVESIDFEFELGKAQLPHFPVPEGKTPEAYLTELCEAGLRKKYGERVTPEIRDRMNYELSVINTTGFAGYILIVQDFTNWALQHRIRRNARGSAAGSLVCYLTDITSVDPIKHGLLFERFLNPERISMPDIDMDFTDRRRDEVLTYVAEKYGKDHVAQIITFGTMAARAVIRDVGRALGYEYSYCDTLAKMIPFGMDLEETSEKVSEFRDLYNNDPQGKKLIDLAKKLEGVARHASTHACGVVISAMPLTNLVPLQHPTADDANIVTQYEMHAIEDLGLLKMDFLGLKNLTIIEDTLARIFVIRNEKIDLEKIPYDDEKTYKILQEALTTSIFQLEGEGMRRYLKELKPTEFEDIAAMVALYRPGPMQFIPDYIERKHGRQKITYIVPELEPLLKNTQGIMIYQEQLMKLAQEIAGFTLGEADVLRKAVGKKIKELLDAQETKFIEGTVKKGFDKKIAKELWQWILPFASYGFNKCVTGDTKIINAQTGKLIPIRDLAKNKDLIEETFSLSENLKVKKSKVINVFSNGKKPVYELRTRSGRTITATNNHPFYTQHGWMNLAHIALGEKIAVPRQIPRPKEPKTIEDYKVAVLGYLLAEGNTCHPYGFYFYSKSKEEINDYLKNLNCFGNTVGRVSNYLGKSASEVYAKKKNRKELSEAVAWIDEIGLKNKTATEKYFPDFVFSLPNEKLELLIGKMFQGDGCINFKANYPQIFYATSSKRLAEGLQHLLLRFGILSTIHKKNFKYRGAIRIGYTVNISRHDNIKNFIYYFKKYLLKNKSAVLKTIEKNHRILNGSIKKWSARGSKDIIPVGIIKPIIREAVLANCASLKEFAREHGFSERLLWSDPRKIGYLRETVQIMSQGLNIKKLEDLYDSDVLWDEVISIVKKGQEETFDLTIEGAHNFIANNIFVHNSHSVAYATIAYQTAYLKAHYPVEFMASVLTSEKADVERIALLIEECKKMGIEVLPPNINESLKNFTVVPSYAKATEGKAQPKTLVKKTLSSEALREGGKIRFGLLAIKNVGTNIIDAIVGERKANGEYKSISDFINRVHSKDLNKKSMEALIKAGAFDAFAERNQLLQNLEKLLEIARENQKNKSNGQIGLFGTLPVSHEIKMEPSTPAKLLEKLTWEKELLGLYVSSHPLHGFRKLFESKCFAVSNINNGMVNKKVILGGIINNVKKIITKSGKPMLFMKFEDLTAKTEIVVFPNLLDRNPNALQENKIVFIAGRVDNRNGELKIVADDVQEIVAPEGI